jgi:Fe-S cluster assembly protein SufD
VLTTYQQSHEAFGAESADSDAVRELRARSLARFEAVGFPTKKLESWRYTSTARLAKVPFVHDAGVLFEAFAGQVIGTHSMPGAAAEVVVVNGRVAHGLSRLSDLPDGVRIRSLGDALAADPSLVERLDPTTWGPLPDAARRPVEPGVLTEDRAFDALNTAFMQDVVALEVDPDVVVDAPIHVVIVAVGEGAAVVAQPRVLVTLGRGAELTLVERHLATGSEATFSNVVTDARLGDGSALTHHHWRLDGVGGSHVQRVRVQVGRDARYTHHVLGLGGDWVRQDLDVRFDQPGGESLVTDVTIAGEAEQVDHHTWLRHDAPHCTSRTLCKGVYGGRARGVFDGLVYIAPQAQQTDAELSNRNLLLTERAQILTRPELQIHADDVKASHGTTVGQLDPNQVTYLRSRGIDAETARGLLTQGFVLDLLEEIEHDGLREEAERRIRARLLQLHGEPA